MSVAHGLYIYMRMLPKKGPELNPFFPVKSSATNICHAVTLGSRMPSTAR